MKNIRSLPPSLRPREKLLKRGAQALTTEELICVLLVTGTKKHSVSNFSEKIAKLLIKPDGITRENLSLLRAGPTKNAQILAILELTRRLQNRSDVKFTSPEQVFANSYNIIHQDKEMLVCFYLNANSELLKKEIVAIGSINRANLLPREIFSLIKELPVAAIILVHNHPSGSLEPSREDILFTKRVKRAGELLGVALLDHLIVSPKGWKRIKA